MEIDRLLADRTKAMDVNVIREILKVVSQPGMVSLAGGIPAPESFALEIMHDLTSIVMDKYGSKAFQYDPTEGFGPLREILVDYLQSKGIKTNKEDILVGSSSQGVLDAIGKVLISIGDKVALEAPTYLGALQALTPYEPEYISLDTDNDGLLPLPKIIDLYRPRQEAMLAALDKYFPDNFNWSRPEGGMFIWAEGPESFDMETLYWKAVAKKVAYVPGKYFYTSRGEGIGTMRLNFTMTDAKTIDRAVSILAEVIEQE